MAYFKIIIFCSLFVQVDNHGDCEREKVIDEEGKSSQRELKERGRQDGEYVQKEGEKRG